MCITHNHNCTGSDVPHNREPAAETPLHLSRAMPKNLFGPGGSDKGAAVGAGKAAEDGGKGAEATAGAAASGEEEATVSKSKEDGGEKGGDEVRGAEGCGRGGEWQGRQTRGDERRVG